MRESAAVNLRSSVPSFASFLVAALASGSVGLASAAAKAAADTPVPAAVATRTASATPAGVDRSGKKRVGIASVYSRKFVGRKMADGTRMAAHDDNAASRTLPLGTQAKVTNLSNGQSATVTIQDRGPYAKGRIVDLSPATAEKIGITPRQGVARVEVKPIQLPPPERDARD